MGVSNYTPTGISHATSVDFSKRSVNQPVHIVQYDRSLPILAVSLYNNGQLYRLSEDMEVSIRLGKPDRTFVYNKALGCDSTRTIVYFEITQQMSLFDGEYYPVIEIMDGDKIANSSTIYLVVDSNPVQHDYIESTIEYKELIDYRDDAVKAGNEAKEAANVASDSAKTAVDKAKESVEASETAVNAANSASASAESIIGVEENVTRIGNMVSEKEPIIAEAAEVASTSATNARQSEINAKASEETSKLSETNAKESETNAKASEEASKLSENNAKLSENNAKLSETNAKASADSIEEIAKASESYAHGGTGTREGEDTDNARYYMEQAKAVSAVDVATADKAGIVKPDGTTITVDEDGTLHGMNTYELPVATTEILGGVKPDGTTITVDEDGTLHGQSKVDEMTGATKEKDGTSGTVPAPLAGQGNLFLRGDGTWAEAKQDLSSYYNNADYTNNKLQLKHDDKVLKEFEIKGSGGATITPKPTVNPQIKNDDKKVVITWEDPTDTVIEGSTFSKWAGTKLVMKESGYPTSPDDGTVLVDNTTRDKYKTTGFEKSGLTNDKQYYFALFPYSTDGVYNYDSGNRLLGEPTDLKIVTFADGTDEEISKMVQAHYNDKINLSDYWAVGDTRSVSLSAMSAIGVGESHRAQTVQFVIGDFNHDDLATPINGHTKAAVTLLQKDCLMDASNASNPVNGSGNTENGYMNSANTNVGGWKNCARRTWCNNVYYNALPSALKPIVKTVNKKSGTGGGSLSGTETTQDKIFLAAEIEIFNSTNTSSAGEGTQYQYYKNAIANRYKMPKWEYNFATNVYWLRSSSIRDASNFCRVNHYSEKADSIQASYTYGIAANLCI